MGQVKPTKLKLEYEKELSVARALKGLYSGDYPSIRKAPDIYVGAYAALERCFHSGQTGVAANEGQQLVTAGEQSPIVRWIYQFEVAQFPPSIEHMQEMLMIL